jgi:hypothetical protein
VTRDAATDVKLLAVRLTSKIISAMQQLALEQRGLLGPRAPWHIGDIAWGLRQHEGR